ncbi:ATP-binding protein [Pontibaca methylaminivorans]|uniref:Serine/threonine-protein kinase RsbW n=1 Tax=Pontibaca methylaminivorans TaxID=515897 RepID=A0A1R3WK68_9RHOB|nr:ATP-binding protein [Pontibaca methylaminivorans]SIT77816.1 serine/threonine-protein kinase RsbW [Pontibaca methylaminivorans]
MTIPPTAPDARRLLVQLALWLPRAGVGADDGDALQIVLAEAVNNIVEHGCCGMGEAISVRIAPVGRRRLFIDIHDRGRKIPQAALACRPAPPCASGGPDGRLSEGGFGWQLIRALVRGVHYGQDGTGNRLCLILEIRGTGRRRASPMS